MSVTQSSQKGVSVGQSVNDESADVGFDLFGAQDELISAIRDGLALLFEVTEADEESAKKSVDRYAYRRVASTQDGLAYVEQKEEVETIEDIYGEVFERLGKAAAPHRRDTRIARGVRYDLSITGTPAGEIGQKKAEMHRLDRGTDRLINGAWGGQEGPIPEGKTLVTEERIASREGELELIRKQAAGEFKQEGRGNRTQEGVISDCRLQKKEREQRVIGSYCEVDHTHDPQRQLGTANPELLGAVNKAAARLAEKYDQSRSMIAREIAARVPTTGSTGDVSGAVFAVRDDLLADGTVIRPIEEIDPDADRVSVVGEVTTLYYPAASNQYQVAIIEDDTGAAKVTIWKKSDPEVTLREGDTVCIRGASPGTYRNQTTLAVRYNTLVTVREKGDGPAKRGCSPEERTATPHRVDRGRKSGSGDPVPRPEAARYQQFEKTLYTAEVVPDSFHEWVESRSDVETVETDGGLAYAITTRRRFGQTRDHWRVSQQEKAERKRLRELYSDYEPEWYERISRVDDEHYINAQYQLAGQGWGHLEWELPWPGRSDERIR